MSAPESLSPMAAAVAAAATRVPLTKREAFALELLVAALASGRDATPAQFAAAAVMRADALIAALHSTP